MAFDQGIQQILNITFAQRHHRLTIGFLIAGGHHRIDRQRILLRRGYLFFQQTPDDARFVCG